MRSYFALPFLAGCFGVYAEVAATTLPSAKLNDSPVVATSVGFNIGADFGSTTKRFALGYASESVSFDGGSATLGTSSSRFDFNVFSVSDRARIRLGAGFALGSGKATANGMTRNDSGGGGGFAGIDFTYFLTWKIAAHAFGGPIYFSESVPGGSISGTGATFRVALSYAFSDIRPDTTFFIPLEDDRDLTGILETGADSLGCTSKRDSHPSSGYAFLGVRCEGRSVTYMQVAQGIRPRCESMFRRECDAFTERLVLAAKGAIKRPTPAAATAAPTAQPTPDPIPEATSGAAGTSGDATGTGSAAPSSPPASTTSP